MWAICPDRWSADHIKSWLLRNDGAEDWEEGWLAGKDGFVTLLSLWCLEGPWPLFVAGQAGFVVASCVQVYSKRLPVLPLRKRQYSSVAWLLGCLVAWLLGLF